MTLQQLKYVITVAETGTIQWISGTCGVYGIEI